MIIDANVYWIPESLFTDESLKEKFFAAIPSEFGWPGSMESIPGTGKSQIILEKPEGSANLNYVQGEYTTPGILADMDKGGIDIGLLKAPGCHEWLTPELCRLFNDGMAACAAESDGRLIPLAITVPGSSGCIAELEYCVETLGMKAVQICAHYGDRYLDDKKFAPFFEKLNEYGMTAYVHHTPVPVEYRTFLDYDNVRRSYGRVVDQGLAIGRELYSGMFDRYPNIRLVHSMLGGGFFAVSEMMMPHGPAAKDSVARFQGAEAGDIRSQFKKHIYFEMSHAQPWGKAQLEAAVKILGADHIVFGSSYPVRREWMIGGPA
ncbi:MAG: amidohydrolase, partial [Clostridiales bacterium]|nr:amidohydrolase [Clostridiales bacterium]